MKPNSTAWVYPFGIGTGVMLIGIISFVVGLFESAKKLCDEHPRQLICKFYLHNFLVVQN